MSIWGSLIGGMIGFSLGGPFGMLLGSVLGGKISRSRTAGGFRTTAQSQRIFALSLIVLSAKLSKADGQVSREELIAVKDKLKIPENEIDEVGKIFNRAKEESTGYEPYAKQIAQFYHGNINVLEESSDNFKNQTFPGSVPSRSFFVSFSPACATVPDS